MTCYADNAVIVSLFGYACMQYVSSAYVHHTKFLHIRICQEICFPWWTNYGSVNEIQLIYSSMSFGSAQENDGETVESSV